MELSREDLHSDPFEQLRLWLREAEEAAVCEPTAMALATATLFGVPSIRTVLLKELSPRGLAFFTDYTSRKSVELEENPQAAALFLWNELSRQVCVEGKVEQTSPQESDAYFATRSRESQLGRWASHQGEILASRAVLENAYAAMEAHFAGQTVPRPQKWGGWRLIPHRFEFWQGREHRLHDRFQYLLERERGRWAITRLYP